jgi:hypothetical protein
MDNNSFNYTYSAKEQEEIKRIRDKYISKEADKMEQLRLLDKSVTQKATAKALVVGIISSLIMGVGMCCCMVWAGVWFIPGIVIGILGIAGVSMAYPVYKKNLIKERERIAPEILQLSDELMK